MRREVPCGTTKPWHKSRAFTPVRTPQNSTQPIGYQTDRLGTGAQTARVGAMKVEGVDESTRAAVLRLTMAERECLKRCLGHQTAKQMALDLGISPHAVEKRLKMARA